LEFGAEEMAVGASAMKGVPRLRNKEAEALVKRLLGTVKNAIEEPIAVLEVKCLIYGVFFSPFWLSMVLRAECFRVVMMQLFCMLDD